MKIALYQGKSLVSKLIRLQTRSKYSHAALILDDGTVVEAWSPGVVQAKNLSEFHTKGTIVDIFDITCPFDHEAAENYALSKLGKKYDYKAIIRFLSRRDNPDNDKYICSELAAETCAVGGGGPLLSTRIPFSHLSPRDIALSPNLSFSQTLMTI